MDPPEGGGDPAAMLAGELIDAGGKLAHDEARPSRRHVHGPADVLGKETALQSATPKREKLGDGEVPHLARYMKRSRPELGLLLVHLHPLLQELRRELQERIL